jgi:hypothetical protein
MPDNLDIADPSSRPLCGILRSSPPSEDLDRFEGVLHISNEFYQCGSDNVILAGTKNPRSHTKRCNSLLI